MSVQPCLSPAPFDPPADRQSRGAPFSAALSTNGEGSRSDPDRPHPTRRVSRVLRTVGTAWLLFTCWACELQTGAAQILPEDSTPSEKSAQGEKPSNRLIHETSPYLLLHAHNPVDWYPWGSEALEKARLENKPIFLSIGYSSCYWCHVMERLVFENEEIAQYMNEHFVNVKVDREERPDLDEIYMLSLQVYLQMTGSGQGGGWPLSMFLTPEGQPIAGGTYFPPEDMPGRPGFPRVMKQVQTFWHTRRAEVERTAEILAREVKRLSQPKTDAERPQLSAALVQSAVAAVASSYDPQSGGFDFNPQAPDGPKFPVPSKVQLIQTQIAKTAAQSAQQPSRKSDFTRMVDRTLQALSAGGIRDHLGGGFHRYSTDRNWHVPHFEKMLYDNAQLVDVFVDAYKRTSKQQYRAVAEETLDFVLRELTSSRGAFFSALDAETDGVEGKYYVWSKPELEAALAPRDFQLFAAVYGVSRPQSFEHGYVLHLPKPIADVADELQMPRTELEARLSDIRPSLLAVREKRPPLLRDDKTLTSWNGLMIRAFANAGKAFQRRDYLAAAEKAALDVLSTLNDPVEGHLLRSARDGEAKLRAYLDDYAFLVSGLLALHEATGEDKWLSAARRLTDDQIRWFWDSEGHGFYFTMHAHETLIARTKTAYDSVIPSGNSVSVRNLVHLSRRVFESKYREYAEQTLQAFASQLQDTPGSLAHMALALDEYLHLYGQSHSQPPAVTELFTGGISSPDSRPAAPEIEAAVSTRAVLQVDPVEAHQHDKLQARGYLSVERLPSTGECLVAVELNIREGWHVNANPPRPDFVIPTRLSLKAPQECELTEITYPTGKSFELAGIDEPLSVYEGRVFIIAKLKLAKVSESTNLTLQLRYQACDHKNCLRPMQITLSGAVPVAARGEPVRPANRELFEKLTGAVSE